MLSFLIYALGQRPLNVLLYLIGSVKIRIFLLKRKEKYNDFKKVTKEWPHYVAIDL
jgi:hypothetical protein